MSQPLANWQYTALHTHIHSRSRCFDMHINSARIDAVMSGQLASTACGFVADCNGYDT